MKLAPSLKSLAAAKSTAPARDSIAEPRLSAGLSDTLPTPKLSAPPDREPANENTSSKTGRLAKNAKSQAREKHSHAVAKLGHVNPQQYIRELDRYHAEQNRHMTRDAVMDVASHEVERVAHLAARVRGRYIAKLLDAGNSEQAGLKEAELLALRRYRESHEELCRGLDLLKSAIAEGDISVSGMTRR